jgi:hypothetical protein
MRMDGRVFFATGVVLSVVAFGFGLDRKVYLQGAGEAVNAVAAAAAAGFAVAGGLCVLAAARVATPPPPGRGRTNFVAVLDQLRFNGVLTDAEYRALTDKLGAPGAEPPGGHPPG